MFTVVWSVKGGVGASVTAASLARAASSQADCLLVDFGGDQAAILGISEPDGPTMADWVGSPSDVALDSLRRIETPVAPNLALLPVGDTDPPASNPERFRLGLGLLGATGRHVVVDLGRVDMVPTSVANAVFGALADGDQSLLVTTPCYLALQRAQSRAHHATGVVLVDDPGRALRRADVAACLSAPVVATIPLLPAVSRVVDAGLLLGRMPGPVRRALRAIV